MRLEKYIARVKELGKADADMARNLGLTPNELMIAHFVALEK